VSFNNVTTQSNLFNLDANSICHLNRVTITDSMIDMAFIILGATTKNSTIESVLIQNTTISQITDYSVSNGTLTFTDLTLNNVSRASYLAGSAMVVLQECMKVVFNTFNVIDSISKLVFAINVSSFELDDVTLDGLLIGDMTFDSAYVMYGSFGELSIDNLSYSKGDGINNPFFFSVDNFMISNFTVDLPYLFLFYYYFIIMKN
jgi:hypothetical protein